MKQTILYFIAFLMLLSIFVIGCSSDKPSDSKTEAVSTSKTGEVNTSEKGAVDKLTDEVAKEAVSRIKTPIDKAKALKDKKESDYSEMEKTIKN